MSELVDNLKASNAHLIEVGQKLEAEKQTNAQTFITHTLEDGRQYYKPNTDSRWEPLQEKLVKTLEVSTLTAIKDYLEKNPDGLDLTKTIVHVTSPTCVDVISTPFGGYRQRDTFMQAKAIIPEHMFDRRVEPDKFVPWLQSCFCESEDLKALLAVSGNIVDTSEVHLQDDGVTQDVTIRQGAARKSAVDVPSPAVLMPFSTFVEINQPPRKFVFRLGSQPLTCSLIEADGGAWKITAIADIGIWLDKNLPKDVRVIA